MEIKNIATFVKVVEFNNFTKAADALGYSQAAVTVQIKALESELGVPLFDRIGKKIFLTQEGKVFLPHAINILSTVQEAIQSVRPDEELVGDLCICSASSYASEVLPDILLEYKKLHPGVNIIVKVSDYLEDTVEKLERGEIDFLLFLGEQNAYPQLRSAGLKRESIVFVTHSGNPLLKKKNLKVADVVADDFIVSDRDIGYCKMLEEELRRRGVNYEPAMEMGSTGAIVNMMCEGYGVSFVPEYACSQALAEGQLVTLPVEDFTIDLYSYYLYSKDRWINPLMQEFIRLVEA